MTNTTTVNAHVPECPRCRHLLDGWHSALFRRERHGDNWLIAPCLNPKCDAVLHIEVTHAPASDVRTIVLHELTSTSVFEIPK